MSYDNQLNQMNELDALLLPTDGQTTMAINRVALTSFAKISNPMSKVLRSGIQVN